MSGIVGEVVDRKEKPSLVRFERVAIEDKAKSLEAGRFVAKEVDYALVTAPYSKDVWKSKVSDWFSLLENDLRNERIPREWYDHYKRSYENWKNGQELPVIGTPIRGWGVISVAKQEELIRTNILTVELLADINDEGIRRLGMGAMELKNKAKAWLQQLSDKGPLTQEVAALKTANENLTRQVETLIRQLADSGKQQEEPVDISANDLIDREEDLVEQYMQKFGKKPHHRMKPETIREALK